MEEAFEKYKQIRDFHDIIGITLLTCVCPRNEAFKPLAVEKTQGDANQRTGINEIKHRELKKLPGIKLRIQWD